MNCSFKLVSSEIAPSRGAKIDHLATQCLYNLLHPPHQLTQLNTRPPVWCMMVLGVVERRTKDFRIRARERQGTDIGKARFAAGNQSAVHWNSLAGVVSASRACNTSLAVPPKARPLPTRLRVTSSLVFSNQKDRKAASSSLACCLWRSCFLPGRAASVQVGRPPGALPLPAPALQLPPVVPPLAQPPNAG